MDLKYFIAKEGRDMLKKILAVLIAVVIMASGSFAVFANEMDAAEDNRIRIIDDFDEKTE